MKKDFVFIAASFFFVLLICMFLPVFSMNELIVCGNNFVSKEQIASMINFNSGENIFLFNKFGGKKNLLANNFIRSAKIKFVLPDKIFVDITERVPCCYIKYLNDSYLLIDNDALVIEISKTCDKSFPLVIGLDFDSFMLGKTLAVKDNKALDAALDLSGLILKNDMKNFSMLIDISNMNDIHLYIKNIDVLFGNIENSNTKIALLKSILDSDSKYLDKAGTLSLKNKNILPTFKFIT